MNLFSLEIRRLSETMIKNMSYRTPSFHDSKIDKHEKLSLYNLSKDNATDLVIENHSTKYFI